MVANPHSNEQIVTAIAVLSQRNGRPIWITRRQFVVASEPLTYIEAKAHCEIQQRVCSLVREGARGPRGGRGKMHYNGKPEWPIEWKPNKFARYWLVLADAGVVLSETENEQQADDIIRMVRALQVSP